MAMGVWGRRRDVAVVEWASAQCSTQGLMEKRPAIYSRARERDVEREGVDKNGFGYG